MDFSLNPLSEFSHRRSFSLLVLQDGRGIPMMRKALLQSAALVGWLQPCDLERMRNRQLRFIERLLRFGNELK